MRATYSTKEASDITGASTATIRTYTTAYARYLSTEATPDPGKQRRFTAADLKLIAFAYQLGEREGATREQVLERLDAGELDTYAWQPPEEPTSAAQSAIAPDSALVPYERLQAAQVLLQDAQQREQALKADTAAQVATLQAEVQRLSQELGRAQGEAAMLKSSRYTAPRWWRAVFGGRAGG